MQLCLRVRSHGLLVYRLCLLPDTPIIYLYLIIFIVLCLLGSKEFHIVIEPLKDSVICSKVFNDGLSVCSVCTCIL